MENNDPILSRSTEKEIGSFCKYFPISWFPQSNKTEKFAYELVHSQTFCIFNGVPDALITARPFYTKSIWTGKI